MFKTIKIAIDVDGVLRNNLGEMVKLYNKEFNDNKSVDDITDFMVSNSFPKIEAESGKSASQWFFQDHSKEMFLTAKPYDNIADDIKRLQEVAEVIIVTYQKSYLNKMHTLKWLEKNHIEPDGICFLKDKTRIKANYLIDDNNWNFIGCNCEYGALISAPYNKDEDLNKLRKQSNCISIERYNSLHDFTEKFLKTIG